MSTATVTSGKGRWGWIPVRVVLVTALLTLLSFAVSLLLGITGIVVVAWARGVSPNMTVAYRSIALPTAAVVGSVALLSILVVEVRRYRRRYN